MRTLALVVAIVLWVLAAIGVDVEHVSTLQLVAAGLVAFGLAQIVPD